MTGPRIKWLQRHLRRFTPSNGWRWFYRKGIRKGIEIGKRHGIVERVNECKQHGLLLYPQFIPFPDGSTREVWMCPFWQEHIRYMFSGVRQPLMSDVERHTGKIFSTTTQQLPGARFLDYLRGLHSDNEAGPETKMHRAIQGHAPEKALGSISEP